MSERRTQTADLSTLTIDRDSEAYAKKTFTNKHRNIVFASAAVIILFIVAYIFTKKINSPPAVEIATATTMYPSQADVILTASGYVVAQRQAAVASKATGRLEYLGVEEGDEVKKGQIIARLERDDVDAALAQARANLQMANASLKEDEAELHDATLQYNRQKNLLAERVISQSEYDLAEARYKRAMAAVTSAKAQIELAKATVRAAEVEVENTNIRAPFDGTVLTKNADVGEMVAPFAASANSRGTVVTIADMNSLEVEADVSESNIQRVRSGQSCEIILDAFPEHRYQGYVHKIVPTADRAKATVLTKIRFVERDEKVLPEMSAIVNFLSKSLNDSDGSLEPFTAIPKTAITERSGKKVVFVVRDNTTTETPIIVGDEFGELVEIRDGLTTGDQVVLNPTADLKSGLKIKIEKNGGE
jgi:RND family efflux transporter MFP subunit